MKWKKLKTSYKMLKAKSIDKNEIPLYKYLSCFGQIKGVRFSKKENSCSF